MKDLDKRIIVIEDVIKEIKTNIQFLESEIVQSEFGGVEWYRLTGQCTVLKDVLRMLGEVDE